MTPAGAPAPKDAARTVALVHYAAPPVIGGVERVLARQAQLIADADHAVRVVAGRGEALDPWVAFHEIALIDPRHPTITRLQQALDTGEVPADFESVTSELADELGAALAGVDVVIAHNVCSLNLNLALTAALRQLLDRPPPPRMILWHHDLAWASAAHASRLHAGLPWDLLRTGWPEAVQVVVSEARRRELAALSGLPVESIRVIPNGIDTQAMLKLEPETSALFARGDVAAANPLLLMPSRVTARKNIELGLRTVAEMRRAGHPAGLIVTGPADPHQASGRAYMDLLHELRQSLGLDGSAWFLSEEYGAPPSDAEISDLYRLADFLFVPSRDEGFGLPILEAAAARLPIVCTDLPSLRELAGDAALYIGPDDDPVDVATRVLEWFESDRVTLLARRVRTRHSWEALYRDQIAPLLAAD
ncbi:MAG TPA: glycosyltransferase [Candidatus Limnocylindria bacterium]|nr:glycosyltransferase [Candidatus Limnocylindria bacterium]